MSEPSRPPCAPPPPHRVEPPPVPAPLALAHARYWRFNLSLIAVLMTIGFCVSFVVPSFALALAALRVAGFSLPFYLGAQGAILIYLGLILVYIVLMQGADRRLRRDYAAYEAAASAAAAATGAGATRSGPC